MNKKEYNPKPVYNRKMMRKMLRSELERKGFSKAGRATGYFWHRMRDGEKNDEESV